MTMFQRMRLKSGLLWRGNTHWQEFRVRLTDFADAVVVVAVLLAIYGALNIAESKTYDEKKAERLAQLRAERRANEVMHEACVRECSIGCSK